MSCCDLNGLNGLFKGPVVEAELRAFKKRGLGKRQKLFLDVLRGDIENRTVLDIGCGIGGLGLSLLAQGAAHSVFVDVSKDYLRAARELAREKGADEHTEFVKADFMQIDLSPADTVVLDRVVCCYPDAPALLRKAAAHSRAQLIFSYPRPAWWMNVTGYLLNLGMRVWRKEYRFYVHEEEELLDAGKKDGHTLQEVRNVGVWRVAAFGR